MESQRISRNIASRTLSSSLCAVLMLSMATMACGCGQSAQSTGESSDSVTASTGADSDADVAAAESQAQSKRSEIANSRVVGTTPLDYNDLNVSEWLNTSHVVYKTGQSGMQEASTSETEYDSEGRVSIVRSSSRGEPSPEHHYSYGDEGTTIQMYDVENGDLVESAPAFTFNDWEEGGAKYFTETRGGSVSSYTVTRYADDGSSSSTEGYAGGGPDTGELSFTRNSVYDDQGRLLRYVQDDLPTSIDSTEYDLVQSWAYAEDGMGAGFSQSGQYDADTNVMLKGSGMSFVVNDAKGRLVYRMQTPPVDGASPTEEFIEYDEWDNPTLRLTFKESAIENKEVFSYDDNGNLLYTVQVDSLGSYDIETYGYVNKNTGEVIEAAEPDGVTLPSVDQTDLSIMTSIFPDIGPIERASYSDGGNLGEFEGSEYGATVSFTSGSNVGMVGTLAVYEGSEDPRALAVGWSTFGTFYAVPAGNGEIIGVGSDGTGITLSPAGDNAYQAHIRTMEGIELDLALGSNQ